MRRDDWEARLAALVERARTARFEWGKFDCCTFAADAVQAVRGDDPLAHLRGSYGSLRAARRLLEELGGLRRAVTSLMGEPMAEPRCAQRGDLVLVEPDGYPALAVVHGASALLPLGAGVQRVPMADWRMAWRVD